MKTVIWLNQQEEGMVDDELVRNISKFLIVHLLEWDTPKPFRVQYYDPKDFEDVDPMCRPPRFLFTPFSYYQWPVHNCVHKNKGIIPSIALLNESPHGRRIFNTA